MKNTTKKRFVPVVSPTQVLTPREYSGSIHGDYGYQINGVKSENGYVSRSGAEKAMYRRLAKMEKESKV